LFTSLHYAHWAELVVLALGSIAWLSDLKLIWVAQLKNLVPVKGKGKGRYSSTWEPRLRATGHHLPCGITQCYLPPDTSERAPPNLSHAGCYL